MILNLILIALILALVLGTYYGVLFPNEIVTKQIPAFTYIYKNHQNNFGIIENEYNNLYSTLKKSKIPENKINKAISCGLYYENPNDVLDKNKLRFSIGLKIDENDKELFVGVLGKEGYKVKQLSSIDSVSVKFPYRNRFSFFFISFPWKRISKYCNENKMYKQKTVGVEFYYFTGDDKRIDIHLTVDEKNNQNYFLTEFEAPKYKEELKRYYKDN